MGGGYNGEVVIMERGGGVMRRVVQREEKCGGAKYYPLICLTPDIYNQYCNIQCNSNTTIGNTYNITSDGFTSFHTASVSLWNVTWTPFSQNGSLGSIGQRLLEKFNKVDRSKQYIALLRRLSMSHFKLFYYVLGIAELCLSVDRG